MNAPTVPAAIAPAAFQILPIAAFAPSTTRTQERRRRRFTKENLAELAASIKKIGVMQPIVARPHPKASVPVKYEIVAGERRWRAADMAGLIEINAIVREVADAELVQFQLTENLQRQTIDALDEAEGYRELQVAKKIRADQVADLLGVSRSTVFNRLKLLDLCPEAVQAIEEGGLTPSNALLVARIGHHDTQRKVLKDAAGDKWHGPMSYVDLQEHIQQHYMVDLKRAPFKLEDEALLPKAGSCAKCPKRTGNQKDLFVDIKNPNVCTDPKCYGDKRDAAFQKDAAALEAKGSKVIAGAAAKKLMPHFENGNDHIQGGYSKLTERHYGSDGRGRTVQEVLGPGFAPTLIQHPGTGNLIKVASTQAIAAALSGKKPKADKPAKARTAAPKLNLPDLDDQVTERVIQLIGEKAPAKFNRGVFLSMAKIIFPEINARGEKLDRVAKRFGWAKGVWRSGSYYGSRRLPKQAEGFDEPKLVLLLLYAIFATSWLPQGNESVLDFLGIDADKIRQTIIGERKKALANARMKAKLAKASPLVKSKGKKKAGKK